MNKYGEPWHVYQKDPELCGCELLAAGDGWMAETVGREFADRIVACVNALAGVSDPAAAVHAARQALLSVIRRAERDGTFYLEDKSLYLPECRAALAALGGEAKP